MRTMRDFRYRHAAAAALWLALGLAAGSGCDDPSAPPPELSAHLAVDMPVTTGSPGDSLALRFTLTNGTAPSWYGPPCCGFTFSAVVRDSAGVEYGIAPPIGCLCVVVPAPLAPGARIEESQFFNGIIYDLHNGQALSAAPGEYTLVAQFVVHAAPPAEGTFEAQARVTFRWLPGTGVASEAQLVASLRDAYAMRDPDLFGALLHPEYIFWLNAPLDDGTAYWDARYEQRIHNRMFRPAAIEPPEPPLPAELWLVNIDPVFTPSGAFNEAPQYYRSDTNPVGLDPAVWRVTARAYDTTVYFDTQGDIDFRLYDREEFVVAANRRLPDGAPGKYTLYRWADLGAPGNITAEQVTWGQVKKLYAP